MKFILATLAVDSCGISGSIFQYAATLTFVGSAGLLFILLWWKGKLDEGEAPKYQMLAEDTEIEDDHHD